MRLLVTITVLYLVTSSVYSWGLPPFLPDFIQSGPLIIQIPTPPCPPCVQSQCDTPGLCAGGKVKDKCGCCTVCAKVKGEKCEVYGVQCAQGLECDMTPDVFDGEARICVTSYKGCSPKYFLSASHGSKWKESCNDCVCNDGVITCTNRTCPARKCRFYGKDIEDGESHTAKPYSYIPQPGCIKCTCRDGWCEYDNVECPGQRKKRSCTYGTSNITEVVEHGRRYRVDCKDCVCEDGVSSCHYTQSCFWELLK